MSAETAKDGDVFQVRKKLQRLPDDNKNNGEGNRSLQKLRIGIILKAEGDRKLRGNKERSGELCIM